MVEADIVCAGEEGLNRLVEDLPVGVGVGDLYRMRRSLPKVFFSYLYLDSRRSI